MRSYLTDLMAATLALRNAQRAGRDRADALIERRIEAAGLHVDATLAAGPAYDVLFEIVEERRRQLTLGWDRFEDVNDQADWITFIVRYAVAAAPALPPARRDEVFRDAMVKVAALAIAAITASDAGKCADTR